MAEQDRPNQNANKSKAEGERWGSERDTVRNADRDEHPERLYSETEGGGITNRPLDEEVSNQEELPERGTVRDPTGDPNARRRQGDFEGSER